MDLERQSGGRQSFVLGPVEKGIVAAALALCITVAGWVVKSINQQQVTLHTLVTQQAVGNAKLESMSLQLVDVPAIRTQNTELKGRVDRLEQDVRDIRQGR